MPDEPAQASRIRRRAFLRGAASLSLAAAGGSLLAACQSSSSGSSPAAPAAPAKPAESKPDAPAAATAPAAKPAAGAAPAQSGAAAPAPAKPIVFDVRNLNTTPVIDAQQA